MLVHIKQKELQVSKYCHSACSYISIAPFLKLYITLSYFFKTIKTLVRKQPKIIGLLNKVTC